MLSLKLSIRFPLIFCVFRYLKCQICQFHEVKIYCQPFEFILMSGVVLILPPSPQIFVCGGGQAWNQHSLVQCCMFCADAVGTNKYFIFIFLCNTFSFTCCFFILFFIPLLVIGGALLHYIRLNNLYQSKYVSNAFNINCPFYVLLLLYASLYFFLSYCYCCCCFLVS